MKHKILIFSIFIIALLSVGCNKPNKSIIEGKFKGKFNVTYKSGKQSGKTTLILLNGKFSCSGNSDRIPAGGSGIYSFDDKTITFSDENIWTADFDWNLILNGQYDYQFDGKNLIIYADKNDVGHYEYRLVKQ